MKRILMILSLAFSCAIVQAQTYEESMRYWSDGPLTWDELTLKSPKDMFRTNNLVFRWTSETEKTKPYWNTIQSVPKYSAALDKSVSWHNAGRVYDYTLQYDQLIFDLNELYFRKMLNEFYSKDNRRSSNELYSFYTNQLQSKWQEMEEETDDGMDSLAVANNAAKVLEELAAISYPEHDERRQVYGMTQIPGLYMDMGINVAYSFLLGEWADTFLPGFGLGMDLTFGYKKHLFTCIVNAGTGTMGADFTNQGVLWPNGGSVNHAYTGIAYGYMVYDSPFFSIIPRAGVAGRQFILVNNSKEKNTDPESFTNTVALAGAEFRFKFCRLLTLYNNHEHCLTLRCLAGRDFGEMNAFSFNITLGYIWSLR